MNVCQVHRLGEVPYADAWALQDRLAQEVARGERPATLLLLEHPHTYTFGRRGHAEHLLWSEEECRRRGVAVFWVDRGGDVTYHGPGQLVGYPLLPLAPGGLRFTDANGRPRLPQADYVGYVRRLEEVLIRALASFGVRGFRVPGMTGVWVAQPQAAHGMAKIAAIGVKVDVRGVSRHGFALNVCPDMTYWQGIIGCGLQGYAVTRLADVLGRPVAVEALIPPLVAAFGKVFGYRMQELPFPCKEPV